MTKPGVVSRAATTVARLGRAAWFFGNADEAAVGVPQLIASANRPAGVLSTGSPLRYFAPVAPAAVGGTGAVLVRSWQTGADRHAVAAATATFVAALGLSAYLIWSINIPLLRWSGRRGGAATADSALASGQRRTPVSVGGDRDADAQGRSIGLLIRRRVRVVAASRGPRLTSRCRPSRSAGTPGM